MSARPPASAIRPAPALKTPAPNVRPNFFRVLVGVVARDLRLELRSREALQAMLFYALLIIVIFSFAFQAGGELTARVGGALLWVAFLFAGLVALDRAFQREMPEACLLGFQISPASRTALLAGKFIASFLLMSAIELLLLPLFAIFFNPPPEARWGAIVLVLLAGTWALAASGVYFSALSLHTRYRALLLPLLLLPLVIPALMAMVQATQHLLDGTGEVGYWVRLLVAFDILYTALGLLLAGAVMQTD